MKFKTTIKVKVPTVDDTLHDGVFRFVNRFLIIPRIDTGGNFIWLETAQVMQKKIHEKDKNGNDTKHYHWAIVTVINPDAPKAKKPRGDSGARTIDGDLVNNSDYLHLSEKDVGEIIERLGTIGEHYKLIKPTSKIVKHIYNK